MENISSLPFVSIIVPVYNGEQTIVKCAESLLAQNYPRDQFEIIFVDNKSKDRTFDILKPYAESGKVLLLSETKVLNAYGARNTGASTAKGEILAFTDADCVAESTWLFNLIRGWENINVAVFLGDILPLDPQTPLERYYSSEWFTLKDKVSSFPGMRGGNCAIRRSCFDELNGFRDSIPSGGDSEFLARIFTVTSYEYRLNLESVVYHKNLESLWAIFRRHLRLGTNLANLSEKFHPNTKKNNGYVTLIKRFLYAIVGLVMRIFCYPFVKRTMHWHGRKVSDLELFVWEPVIRIVETAGTIIGKALRSPKFR
jgi:glycosyltransferase involved in cell wall biosynthesis